MSNRQNLKALQERLAQRLAAAKTQAVTASWLAVEVGSHRCLLPLVQSGEIHAWTAVQAVPYTQPWFVGVASLRGGLFGVVDLLALPGLASDGSRARGTDRVSSESRLVSLHAALGVNAVLWVDRLLGLRNASAFRSLAPALDHAAPYMARRLVDEEGGVWQELDLQRLAEEPEFLAIAA